MGRASNRKKAQRRAGQRSRGDAVMQREMYRLVAGLEAMVREMDERTEREAAARRSWSGRAEPVSAGTPRWAEDSLGDRFFGGTFLEKARSAPYLANAQVPDAAVIAADPAHWNIATDALIRAVVYDDLALDHPAVRALLEVLAPIGEAELAYGEVADAAMYGAGPDVDGDEPEFPEEDGPVFRLGGCALIDAVWAAVGEDSLSDVLGVLVPALDNAVRGLGGRVAADALIGAFGKHYQCTMPGEADVLERIGDVHGDALKNLVRAGAVPPRDVLPAGLALLSALARLCRSDSASLLHRV